MSIPSLGCLLQRVSGGPLGVKIVSVACPSFSDIRREATTDLLGRFRLDSLGPGRHALWIQRLGYVARRDTIALVAGTGASFEVGLERQSLDGCPGFGVLVARKRVWRWSWS